ncbi:MAG: DUF2092 domain-containing protein [Burkholderiales bacterium]|nr:DUF2092 domain-containing protein [Burkholderiales bacterium]
MFVRVRRAARLVVALLAFGGLPAGALAQPAGIDPQALAILKKSTDYVAGLEAFSVDTTSTIEVVLTSGQKIQFDHAAVALVQRPDKLVARRQGDLVNQTFYYDGKHLTLYNPGEKYYATVAAPDTLEGALDFARERLDIIAPASDLFYRNAYELLTADIKSGFVVGKAVVGGARCDHLAFRNADVDWQIWIEEGARPLPRKYVITSTQVVGAPQFAALTTWNTAPKFVAGAFVFTPPKDGRKIDFLRLTSGTAPAQGRKQ